MNQNEVAIKGFFNRAIKKGDYYCFSVQCTYRHAHKHTTVVQQVSYQCTYIIYM